MNSLRRTAMIVALASSTILGGWLAVHFYRRPCLVAGPMVQMVTPSSFAVVWRMQPAGKVEIHLTQNHQIIPATYLVIPDGDWYQARFSNLQPASGYEYAVRVDERSMFNGTVRTAPNGTASFRVLAFGDSGKNTLIQHRLARAMVQWSPDLILHTGDMVTPYGVASEVPAKFVNPYVAMTAHVPIYACLGNHDVRHDNGRSLLEAMILPENGPASEFAERDYWFDYGGARFVAIDSNVDEPMLRERIAPWLDRVLADAGDQWKVLFCHEPPYTNGHYTPAAKLLSTIVPVLERHGAHLVLNGHNHMYERSYPIRDGQVMPPGQGTVYLVTAAGGCNLYEAKQPPPSWLAVCRDDCHSFTILDFTANDLAIRQIDVQNRTMDEFHLPRCTREGMTREATTTQTASSQGE